MYYSKTFNVVVNCCLDLHDPSCSSCILHMCHTICSHWFGGDLERLISSMLFTVMWVGSITYQIWRCVTSYGCQIL